MVALRWSAAEPLNSQTKATGNFTPSCLPAAVYSTLVDRQIDCFCYRYSRYLVVPSDASKYYKTSNWRRIAPVSNVRTIRVRTVLFSLVRFLLFALLLTLALLILHFARRYTTLSVDYSCRLQLPMQPGQAISISRNAHIQRLAAIDITDAFATYQHNIVTQNITTAWALARPI